MRNFNSAIKRHGFFNISIFDKWQIVFLFISISLIFPFGENCIYIQYLFHAVRNQTWTKRIYWNYQLIKRRSKVYQKHAPNEHTLNFDQSKPLSKNYKLVRVSLWLVYKLPKIIVFVAFLQVHSNVKEESYLPW